MDLLDDQNSTMPPTSSSLREQLTVVMRHAQYSRLLSELATTKPPVQKFLPRHPDCKREQSARTPYNRLEDSERSANWSNEMSELLRSRDERWRDASWIMTPLAADLLEGEYVRSILVAVNELPALTTSDLVRYLNGRPSAVIRAVRRLESLGVVNRRAARRGRRSLEIRLTLRGLQLVDTPLHHWGRLFRKWTALH